MNQRSLVGPVAPLGCIGELLGYLLRFVSVFFQCRASLAAQLLAAVAMASVISLAQHAKARYKRMVDAAAFHLNRIILYDFCRLAAGLRSLLTAMHLQAQLGIGGDGQGPGSPD